MSSPSWFIGIIGLSSVVPVARYLLWSNNNSPIGLLADVAKKPRRVGTEGSRSLGK